jgi:predicted phage terminase large subunit-like protein
VSITNDRRITIEDIVGIRADPGGVEALIAQTAALDGKRTAIRIEQEPGSSGKDVIAHYVTDVLQGYDIEGVRSTGSKEERAAPVSSQAKVGNIRLVRGEWNNDFLSEAVRFPLGAHDDQVDAVSGALAFLADGGLPMQWITKSTEFRAKHLPAPETDEQRTARRLAEYLAQQNG